MAYTVELFNKTLPIEGVEYGGDVDDCYPASITLVFGQDDAEWLAQRQRRFTELLLDVDPFEYRASGVVHHVNEGSVTFGLLTWDGWIK